MQTSGVRTTPQKRSGLRQRSRRGLPALLTIVVVLVLTVLGAPTAVAHTELTDTSPADGQILQAPPATLILSFTEPVGAATDSAQLFTPAGDAVPLGVQAVDTTVTLTPGTSWGSGTHTVVWQVSSADGHPVSGSFTFSVGAPSATTAELPQNDPLPQAMIAAQTG